MPLFSPSAANRGEAEACLDKAKFEARIAERTARYAKAVKLAKKAIRLFGNPCPQEARNLLHSLELKQKHSSPSNYRAPQMTDSQNNSFTSPNSARQRFVNNRPDSEGGWENKESPDRQRFDDDTKDNAESSSHHSNFQNIELWQYLDLPAAVSYIRVNPVSSWGEALNQWFNRLPIMHESHSTIKKLMGITLFLGMYRLFFGRMTMFSLPGDFNYQSNSVFLSVPLISGIVIVTTIQAVFILIS